MFSRSREAQWVGSGLARKVFSALRRNSRIHGASFLTLADVVDGPLGEAGAGVEVVFDVVLEVAGGLVDAGDRIGGGLGLESVGVSHGECWLLAIRLDTVRWSASVSGVHQFLLHPVVALGFEFEGEALVAAADDAAVVHDMHEVGHDVVEEALVVGDEQDAELTGCAAC